MSRLLEENVRPTDTAGAWLDRAAALWPQAAAVRDAQCSLSYREFAEACRRVASWLRSRGVDRGDRVLMRVPNSVPLCAFVLGAARIGAVAVPVSQDLSLFQFRTVVVDAEPGLVICADAESEHVRSACTADVVPLSTAWAQARAASPLADAHVEPDDLFLLIYTSGSTSSPKGVMCTHRQVGFAVSAIAQALGYRSDDAIFCRLPLSFDYGLYQLFLCIHAGAELQLPERDNDPRLVTRIREWRSTVVPLVPSLADMLVRLARRDARPTAVRLFTNTGAALEPKAAAALRQRFPGSQVCLMYGITECKRVSILEPDGDLDRPHSVGRPLTGTSVDVVDERGRSLPAKETGQIVVRGPHVMQGYWRAPELTRERFGLQEGGSGRELRTGDYGHKDEQGYLYFSGRRDDIFKQHGVRVSTLEIEAAALDVEGVRAAAALPPQAGRGAALFVVGCAPATVMSGLRSRLERAKLPSVCHGLEEIPLTANGKVDKAALEVLGRQIGPAGSEAADNE